MALPTQRSLDHLRRLGYEAGVVERKLPKCFITVDLFGFGDIVAMKAGEAGALIVQTTGDAGGNVSARVKKILGFTDDPENPKAVEAAARVKRNAKLWLSCGNRIVVHGWGKRGAAGKRKVWTIREIEITPEMFDQPAFVSVGGVPCTDIKFVSSTQVTARTGAAA